jgi:DNA helicase-2/ATP-dependent DNA helicase PcrA
MLHGQTRYNIPSRFLQEIPDSLLRWLQPVQKTTTRNYGWGIRNQEPVRLTPGYACSAQTGISNMRNSPESQWKIGQNVIHTKFGTGVIVNCEGQGPDARVEVKFGRVGTKWLSLEYAKLVPA